MDTNSKASLCFDHLVQLSAAMQSFSFLLKYSALVPVFFLGLGILLTIGESSGVTIGTNETFAYIKASTPTSDSQKVDSITLQTNSLTTTFSNQLAVADAFGSAQGYLAFTNITTLANDELRSVRVRAAGGGTAQGASSMPDRGHGSWVEAGLLHSLTFFSSNQTIVDIKSSGQVRLYFALTNTVAGITNLHTGAVGIDVAPIHPIYSLQFDRMVRITNEVRTERLSFPGGAYHRIEIHLFDGAQIDAFNGSPDNPSGNSTIDVELTFTASTNEVRWVNPSGGSYFRTNNWNPPRVPEKSDRRADVALFDLAVQYEVDSSDLAAASIGAFSTPLATAERWVLQGGEVRNLGGAKLFGSDPSLPSLSLGKGSRLNLQSGTLSTVNTRIGDGGAALSEVWIMGDRSKWTNSGFIFVGEYGSGQILGFDSELKTEEVRLGMGQKGEAYLRGRQAKWEAGNVAVGYINSTGKLSIESGAYMETRGLYLGYEEGSRGELVISGRSSERASTLWSLGTNEIGRLGPAEMKVLDGATFVHSQTVNLSAFQASVTRSRPARLIAQGVHASSGNPSYIFGGGEIFIGGGGSLEARDGALIEFASGWIGLPGGGEIHAYGVDTPTRKRSLIHFHEGLILGWVNDAYSSMTITNGAKVLIEDETQFGGLSEYFVAIHTEKDGYSAELEVNDPVMEINAGQVIVFPGGLLRTKSAILSGKDDLDAQVIVDTDPIFPGWIAVGDIRIGSSAGPAELALQNGAVVSCTGTVTTHPARGRITGVGTIRTLTLTNSGTFSGGNSPGTITIDGDFVQTETGKLEIEINGSEPGRFDVLKVTGKAQIGGTIEYVFNDYFIPRAGDKFAALQVTGPSVKTALEIFPGKPLGVANMETRVTNGIVEITSLVGTNYNVLQQFGADSEGATNGWGPLTLAQDRLIYGCLRNGGRFGGGAIYSIQPEGHDFRVLHHFNPTNEGAQPLGGIVQASGGGLFGTCSIGGTNNAGTIWTIKPGGKEFRVARHFGVAEDVANPSAELMERSDGVLLGTAQNGGSANRGGVFQINQDGRGYRVLNDFGGAAISAPRGSLGALVEGAGRVLYGTSERGGSANNGAVFAITPNGAVTTIASLGVVTTGAHFPQSTLLLDEDGMLYGTTYGGGTSNFGTIFAVRTNGENFRIVKSMGVTATEGREPRTGLVEAPDGMLLGTTRIGGGANQGTVFRIRKDGSQFANVRSFSLQDTGGARVRSPLLQTAGGVFYGTTFGGGTGDQGVLFRIFTPGLIPAPVFSTQPQSVINAPGATITLTAGATGNQHLRYQWMRNGTNIPGAFSETLTLSAADATRVGEYKLHVAGLTGEVTSTPAEVSLFSTTNRALLIQGTPGNNYRIETTEQLGTPAPWTEMTNVVLSGGSIEIPIGIGGGARFYRAALISP